ncbi:MAG TPA: FAD-dependent oxidoreductase [Bryobacteraceae bacterium]|nr:FAD-dependent oxidoreductase [Bryobacteraceae bacterium]
MKLILILLLAPAGAPAQTSPNVQPAYDLAVYGGTAGGVVTAVRAARMGLRVALIEPGGHIGGMVSGGLSHTDIGKREVIGGDALEFYWRAGLHYGLSEYAQSFAWYVEPKVAESIFRRMLQEAGVSVLLHRQLREKDGVQKEGQLIRSISLDNGDTVTARVFADATYEGDLMAQAGVTYTWGRESSSQYGEPLAGVRAETPFHQFQVDLPPVDTPVSSNPGQPGAADRKVQAYNFRLIVSHDPENQVPYPKPAHYDPRRYELLARLLQAMQAKLGRPQSMGEVLSIGPIPNRKADINNNGPVSTDYIGKSWDYPNADYRRRAEIRRDHEEYTQGFLYFLAHDPAVPPTLQKEVNEWGLARDEFVDNGNFPHQLYIREARRMVGEYVMTQKDIQTDLTKPDAIGMGTYNSDSHNVQRVVNRDGFLRNEGDMQVPVQPYQIPYRMLVPRRGETRNLLVPVCFSASHVAYSTLRMEPQYMIAGQAAGVAAALAIQSGRPVQEIDTSELTRILLRQGAILEYAPSVQTAKIPLFHLKPDAPPQHR